MKKIISFLLLAALLVGCMVPAVIVSAADVAITAENVEKIQGTGVEVAPAISISNNPGLSQINVVVYYNASELARSEDDEDALANSAFDLDESEVSKEYVGSNKNLRDYVPEELQETHKGFVFELYATEGEAVTADGIIANLPLTIVASEAGAYTYNVVVAEAYDADGEEVEIAATSGTITYAADPFIGVYDEFTVFMNPGDIDVEQGTETIDVDIRFDANPGLWATRLFIAYPEALTLANGADANITTNNAIFNTEVGDTFMPGIVDLPLDDPRQVGAFQDIMNADPNFVKEGYHSTNVYFEGVGFDTVRSANGVLCTLHFTIDPSVEIGDVLDIKMYYSEADFLYAGTLPDGSPDFVEFYPPVIGANLTIVEKICEHTVTSDEHLDPTCGVAGYDRVVCDECGEIISETVIEATGNHTEGEAVIVESTCTVAGTSTVSCTVCGEVLSETALDLAAHTPGDAATCQAAQTCTVCGAELAAKLPHTEGAPVVTNPTCDEDGKDVYNCVDCGEFLREEIRPAVGHLYLQPQNTVVTSPTCTEEGYTTRYCDVCGEPKVEDFIPAWGHDKDGGEVVVDSTCTVAGTKTIYCLTCGEISEVIDLPLADHSLTAVDAYGPFCHTAGIAAHWACEDCGALFADAEGTEPVTEADLVLAPENELVHIDAAPACHVPGRAEYWYCPECDSVYADAEGTQHTNRKNLEIPADTELVHMEKVEPCHANGTEEYWFCPDCEAVYADAEGKQLTNRMNLTIPADAEAKHVEAVAATCTENGCAEYWYCEECDTHFADAECKYNVAYLSLTIPATGHNYENGVCTVCGEAEKEEDTDTDKAPVTGDNVVIIACVLAVVLVAGTASVVIIRRRRSTH